MFNLALIDQLLSPIQSVVSNNDIAYSNRNFRDLDFSGRHFWRISFENCDFENVKFDATSFNSCQFKNCNLKNASFEGAFFREGSQTVTFEDCILPDFQIPQDQELIVYKKLQNAYSDPDTYFLCKIKIPADAKRTASLVGKKCRAEKAVVVSIQEIKFGGELGYFTTKAYSLTEQSFEYEVGKEISPRLSPFYDYCDEGEENIASYHGHFNDDFRFECKPGIHFFMTQEEAINYVY